MPDYSVVIPVYNEADYLPRTLNHLEKAIEDAHGDAEVIVVDNNSNDKTAEIARQ